jgi:heterodisulfide reductase subunit D
MMDLNIDKDSVFICAQCGFCNIRCPIFNHIGWESYGPRGKMYLLKNLINRNIKKIDEKIKELIYMCTTCKGCEQVCQTDIEIVELWEVLRENLVNIGIAPMEAHRGILKSIKEFKNPFKEKMDLRDEWAKDMDIPEKGDILYFAGCTSSYRLKLLARDTVTILKALKEDFSLLGGDEWCCGSVLLRTGQTEYVKNLVFHNIEMISKSKAKLVIISCTGCLRTFMLDYPKIYGSPLPFEVIHITGYLKRNIEKLKFRNEVKKKATYHDPCHLGLHLNDYDTPREILMAIPGIELIEMDRIREDSFCCGAGGGVKSAFPDLALDIAKERVNEALSTSADILVSACPFCKLNLSQAIDDLNSDIIQMDVVELVTMALGLKEV